MRFELLPVIDVMLELYRKPRDFGRFREYLQLLQGDTKGDLALPLGGFNPMAKEHVVEKLVKFKKIDAEKVISDTLSELNISLAADKNANVFKVALSLSDDLQGGWTNRYTADYDSKFKINALVNRLFCVPVFWVSEPANSTMVHERTLEYAYRTLEWLAHPRPQSLEDHVQQEKRVAQKIVYRHKPGCDRAALDSFYRQHKDSRDYSIIFNFFYGDAACRQLGFATYGVGGEMPGFCYCRQL